MDNPPPGESWFVLLMVPHRHQHGWDVDLFCHCRPDILTLLVLVSNRPEVAGHELFPTQTRRIESQPALQPLIKELLEQWSPILATPAA